MFSKFKKNKSNQPTVIQIVKQNYLNGNIKTHKIMEI